MHVCICVQMGSIKTNLSRSRQLSSWAFLAMSVLLRSHVAKKTKKKHLWICWEYLIHEWAVKKLVLSPPEQPELIMSSQHPPSTTIFRHSSGEKKKAKKKKQKDAVFWHRGGYYGNIEARPLWWHSACVINDHLFFFFSKTLFFSHYGDVKLYFKLYLLLNWLFVLC